MENKKIKIEISKIDNGFIIESTTLLFPDTRIEFFESIEKLKERISNILFGEFE